jgi:hypothetical protein
MGQMPMIRVRAEASKNPSAHDTLEIIRWEEL